jgi:hypothetical protein
MEKDEHFTDTEIAKRRDEVVRRMANTPPQPKLKSPRKGNKKKASGGVSRKSRADREA